MTVPRVCQTSRMRSDQSKLEAFFIEIRQIGLAGATLLGRPPFNGFVSTQRGSRGLSYQSTFHHFRLFPAAEVAP